MRAPALPLTFALVLGFAVPGASRAADAGAKGAASPSASPSATPSATPEPRRARVAVKVGDTAVTVGEIEDRLAEIPPFQRRMFGATPEAQAKAYVEQVVVRDLLLAEGARQKELATTLPTSQQLLRARSSATIRALRKELASPAQISDADVQKYYDDNRSRFDSPERIHLWRVLAKTREEAEQVLAAAKKGPTTQKWNELAREHSLDKATNLRGGNLGFVGPDGASNEAGVVVDPVLVKAASAVKDGELVPQPVPEGPSFAVVWRRGTVPANKRTVEEATAQIRTTLFRERTEGAEKKLIERLRTEHVEDVNLDLLGAIDLGAMDAGVLAPRVVSPRPTGPAPGPRPTPSP